jgi:hypothetical protein
MHSCLSKFLKSLSQIQIILQPDFLGHAVIAGRNIAAALLHHRQNPVHHAVDGFLSSGNGDSEEGRALGETLAARSSSFAENYLHGERYKRSPELVRQWHDALPFSDSQPPYVSFRPLDDVKPEEGDVPDVVSFVVNADQLSCLVVLANYATPRSDRVTIPFGSGCQSVGLLAFAEAASAYPRAVVGLTDLSARKAVRRSLGPDSLTFTMPWKLFLEMEENAAGSFFDRQVFRELMGRA